MEVIVILAILYVGIMAFMVRSIHRLEETDKLRDEWFDKWDRAIEAEDWGLIIKFKENSKEVSRLRLDVYPTNLWSYERLEKEVWSLLDD